MWPGCPRLLVSAVPPGVNGQVLSGPLPCQGDFRSFWRPAQHASAPAASSRDAGQAAGESLLFLPAVMLLASVAVAVVLAGIDGAYRSQPLPWTFSFAPGTASTLPGIIAGATITTAGVVFSLLVVSLQLASGQFSPRVLRGFWRDAGHVLIECRRHGLQAGAHGQGQQAFAAPAISAIDTITCSGTATSPGSGSGWAPDRPVPPGLLGDHRRDPAISAIVLIRSFRPGAAGGSPPGPPRKAPLSPFGSAGAGVIGQGVSICLARWVSVHVPTTRSRRPA